jgi:CRP-like cAMP-binding protein
MFELNIKRNVVPLINKNWEKNNKEILDKLKEILLDSIYFKCLNKISPTYSESITNNIITSFEFKKYSKNDILLNYNDPVTKLYFIFKGRLNIYKVSLQKANYNIDIINHEYHEDKDEILQYFYNYIKKYLKSIKAENIFMSNLRSIYNMEENEAEENKNKKEHKFEPLFKNIIIKSKELDCSLTEGKVFGEEFLYNNIPFSNCILECGSDCIIGEINKEDYDILFKRFNKLERSFTTIFLVNLKLFDPAHYFFSKFAQCLKKRYFAKNEIIFKQHDKFHAFYLIRNGKINLSLRIPRIVNCELEPDLIMGNLKKERFTSNKTYLTKGKYSEIIDYNLITLQTGEFIGDIEYYEKNENYIYTAKCLENTILFEIDIELFEHFIINNYAIKDNLKVFYEKIKDKMQLLQERIYNIRMNNSAIKKSDYILSKNKFTKNILQGHPLKEDEKVNNRLSNENKNITCKKNKTNDNENFYINMISPFLKRYSSASKCKKFTKIKFNNDFFKNRNNKELFLKTKKNYKLRENKDMNSKLLNSNSLSITKVTLSNKILTDINEAQSSYRSLNKSKIKNLIERNNNNFKFDMKTDNVSNIFEELKKKKIPKMIFNFNKTERESEKLYDFMDADLIFSKSNINQNIPKIMKSTKETNIFKQRYNKVRNSKLIKYYFKSPKEKTKKFS